MDLALIATGGGVKSAYDKGIKMLARPSIAQHCLVKRCKNNSACNENLMRLFSCSFDSRRLYRPFYQYTRTCGYLVFIV